MASPPKKTQNKPPLLMCFSRCFDMVTKSRNTLPPSARVSSQTGSTDSWAMLQTGVLGWGGARDGCSHPLREVLPPAVVGPPLHGRAHTQAVLTLFFLLLLLPVFQPVHLHSLGGLGLPGIFGTVGQSHDCEYNNLSRSRCRVIPPGILFPQSCGSQPS